MRSIRLPETDLANLAFDGYDLKVKKLLSWLAPKQIAGSYEPLRRSVGEAASVGLPLVPELERTTLAQLELLVTRECRGNSDKIAMNMPAVRSIRAFVDERSVEAFFLEELPMTLYPGMRYSFWAPILIRYDGKSRIVFMDLRRTNHLSASGTHFCFSVIHERFRVLDPNFAKIGSEVWRFTNNTSRAIRVIQEFTSPIPYEKILADVAETYSILNALRSGRTGSATPPDYGPLFR